MSSGCAMRCFVHATALALCFALTACVSSRGLHTTGTLTDPRSPKAEQSLADVPLSPTAWPRTGLVDRFWRSATDRSDQGSAAE
jgi:hypothetical protein